MKRFWRPFLSPLPAEAAAGTKTKEASQQVTSRYWVYQWAAPLQSRGSRHSRTSERLSRARFANCGGNDVNDMQTRSKPLFTCFRRNFLLKRTQHCPRNPLLGYVIFIYSIRKPSAIPFETVQTPSANKKAVAPLF